MYSAINFGKNPVNGGKPPRDMRSIEVTINKMGLRLDIDLIFFVVFMFNLLKIINMGPINKQ
jgi:hypothetical protein